MDEHLSDEQLDLLWKHTFVSSCADIVDSGVANDLWTHVKACDSCRLQMQHYQILMQRLSALRSSPGQTTKPECPAETVWLELAAGLPVENSEYYLSHATQCDHCGTLLRNATDEFRSDLSAGEELTLLALESSHTEWQREISERLLTLAHGRQPAFKSMMREGWQSGKVVIWVATTAAVTILALLALELIWQRPRRDESDRLVAAAYEEDRTIQMRIEGAGYTPFREARGNAGEQERMSRPALLTAEAQIAARLRTAPEDVRWIQASGRASLLEGDWKAAMTALQKAQRIDEQNLSIKIDLASAYILRGDMLGDSSDYGQATELLGRVLVSEPHSGVAQFNQAIAEEKQPELKKDAIEEWQRFLEDHGGDTQWAAEARSHLTALRGETGLKEDRIRQSLWPAEQLAQVGKSPRDARKDEEIDSRIEAYQDFAIQRWLPVSYGAARESSATVVIDRTALNTLADLLTTRHHDKWMKDILEASQSSQLAAKAIRLMSSGTRLVRSSQDDHALRDEVDASRLFEKANVPAGFLYSQFTIAYVDQLLHQNAKCAAIASGLAPDAAAHGYQWLAIQSKLEIAICASMDDERGLGAANEALRSAESMKYPDLSLRARNVVSALSWYAGDTRDAWLSNIEGMRAYWAGWSPPMRAYSLLDSLDEIAQEQHKWFLASAILRESIPMLQDNPDPAVRTFEEVRLSEALLNAGASREATISLLTAQKLFDDVPSGSRRGMLQAEIALGLAKAEISEGKPADALRRLDDIGAMVTPSVEDDLRLDYFATSGFAAMAAGHSDQARSRLEAALQLAERGLTLTSTEGDRLRWLRRNENLYRALVEMELPGQPERAWAYWELYKGSAVGGRSPELHHLNLHSSLRRLLTRRSLSQASGAQSALLMSYFLTRDRVYILVSDGTFIRVLWSDISESKLLSAIYRFSEECENPASDLSSLIRDGQELYGSLISPVERLLAGHSRLLVEPDGALSLLPFGALVNSKGEYLSEHASIAISPGLLYLSGSRAATRVNPQTPILIIGNPTAPGWRSLPDSDSEARRIAAKFEHSNLLLGDRATLSNVAQDLPGVQIVHFAGHSSADADAADLIFAGSQRAGLNVLRMLSHRNVTLVVLASCSSAQGKSGMFDDGDSIVRGLLGSGVPAVVASLWNVDSDSTFRLMDHLYDQLLEGHSISESLAAAAQCIRSEPRFAHPFYWAAFSTFGKG